MTSCVPWTQEGTNALFSMKDARSGDDGENVCIIDIIQSFYFLLRISSYFYAELTLPFSHV